MGGYDLKSIIKHSIDFAYDIYEFLSDSHPIF